MRMTTARLLLAGALALSTALPVAAEEPTLNFDTMTTSERDAFGRAVRSYLLENPEVIFEAIQILEERRNDAKAAADSSLVEQNAEALYADGYSWVGGNPDGDVTIVEFSDYRCGYCKRAHPQVQAVLEADPNVRLIVKEFPILGEDSVAAGRMAMAALDVDPSLYGALNDELMRFEGSLTEALAYRIAADVGYDIAALKERAGSDEIENRMRQNYALADTLGIEGTPSFVIGGRIMRGYIETDAMLAAVEEARSGGD